MKAEGKTIIVAGAQGVIGRAAAQYFSETSSAKVYGISRRPCEGLSSVETLSLDLLDAAQSKAGLGKLKNVTHLVFAAYVEKDSPAERSAVNVALLRNLLDTVESNSPGLRHVTMYQGGKAYGADLGAFKTPAREDDLRLMSPNFYYDQEDYLRSQQAGKNWNFTILRPEAVCGYAVGNPMNLGMVIAVYAVISKELGLPLRFPGSAAAWNALYQLTSAKILASATAWAGESKSAANQIFNITNGDYFRWKFMWPRIAKMFDMETAEPVTMPLHIYMADKAEIWNAIARKHGLKKTPYESLVSWRFGDAIFNSGFDNITSTIKARQAGFNECIDSEDMFRNFFDSLRELKVIPAN